MLKVFIHQFHRWPVVLPKVTGNLVQVVPNRQICPQWFSITPTCHKVKKKQNYLKGVQSIILHYYKTLKTSEANTFVKKYPILKTLDKHQLDAVMDILKREKYTWKEIQDHKEVLTFTPNQIRSRLKFLEEFCIRKPRLHELIFSQAYMHSTVGFLRKYRVYSENFDITDHLLKNIKSLELPDSFISELKDKYKHDMNELLLKDLYFDILKKYLSLRFPSDTEAIELLFKSEWKPQWKPLVTYKDICDIIIGTLGLDFSYLMSNSCILDIDPLNVIEIFDNYSKLGGVPTKEIAIATPELLLVPYSQIKRWADMLWKYKVTKFKFTINTLRFFRGSNFTEVEARLKVLSELPEWRIISLSDQLFVILRRPHGLKRLLDTVHSGHNNASIISGSQEPSQRPRKLPQEVVMFLAEELDIEVDEAHELLNTEVRAHFGVANTRMVLELLFSFGFTRDQILNGVQLLNFEYAVVYEGLMQFPNRPEAQPFDHWMDNPHVLHLLAYCIKKDAPHLQLSAER